MQSIVLNVPNDQLLGEILHFLEPFRKEGVEVASQEDMEEWKLLAETRNEDSISLEEYLKNEG